MDYFNRLIKEWYKNDLGAASNVRVDVSGVISWDEAENAVSYKVEKIVNGRKYFGSRVTGTSYKLVNHPGIAYRLKVIAFNDNGDKKWSSELYVPAKALGTVINPEVDKNGVVKWDAAENATAYRVGKIVNGKVYYGSKTSKTSYTLKNIPSGEYRYFVKAYSVYNAVTIGPLVKVSSVAKAANVRMSDDNKTVSWTKAEGTVKYQAAKMVNGRIYYGAFVTGTSYTFKNTPETGELIYIIAFDKNNKTSYSDVIVVK